ncbi:MAG: SDR family oxidoreductase [Magnetococcus sp. DMHC-6]
MELEAQPKPKNKVFQGISLAFAFVIGLPFVIFLLPMWYVYRWSEIRAGRKPPKPPWFELPVFRHQQQSVTSSVLPPKKVALEGHHDLASVSIIQAPMPVIGTGRVALVTGGGHRLGAAICLDLAALGFKVGVAYHQAEAAAQGVVEQIRAQGGQACALSLDLRNPARISSILNELERQLGPIDLLVNNAALFQPTQAEEESWEGLEGMMQVNLIGPFWLALQAGQQMGKRGGQMIQICDIWGQQPLKGYAAYSVSKAGLIMATRALARDLAPFVRVNAIAPGVILAPDDSEQAKAFHHSLGRTPLASQASPEAVIRALRYLLAADYVTGEVLSVDGGRRLV